MILYTGNILHLYEWTEPPIGNDGIEQVKQLSSDEKVPLVKDKYIMFEWAPGIPILDETQEESPYIFDEDELDVKYGAIIDDDNEQEEDEYWWGFNII